MLDIDDEYPGSGYKGKVITTFIDSILTPEEKPIVSKYVTGKRQENTLIAEKPELVAETDKSEC